MTLFIGNILLSTGFRRFPRRTNIRKNISNLGLRIPRFIEWYSVLRGFIARRHTTLSLPLILLFLILSPLTVFGHLGVDSQIIKLTEEIEKASDQPLLYVRRGELYRVHGDWERAITDFNRAKSLDSQLKDVDIYLSKVHLDAGKPELAKRLLSGFLTKEPDHVTARILRAKAEVGTGRYRLAAAGL